jgi:sec-independent protein translocase protein TatA
MSIWHWIVVIAVVLLLFGRNKISDLMGDVAQGIKAFKKGMSDDAPAADASKTDSSKTIEAGATKAPGDLKGRAETERKIEGSLS